MKSNWIVFLWIFLFLWMIQLNNSGEHSGPPGKIFENKTPGLEK
mgnify:CR=1 FL=1